jgi:predicted GNAT family acetyltransferase
MEYRDDPDNWRFVAEDGDTVAGQAIYMKRGGRRLFVHTEVDDAYEGQGVGSGIVKTALDQMLESDTPILPLCPFFAKYIEKHPEYAGLVDTDLMAQINAPAEG